MYSTIRLYTTEGNAKALESAERIGGTAALTDWVAKMVVVLELLTPLSIKQLSSMTWTSSDAIAELIIEVELYVKKYTNTPSAPSYCTRYFFNKSMPPPNNVICSLKWLGTKVDPILDILPNLQKTYTLNILVNIRKNTCVKIESYIRNCIPPHRFHLFRHSILLLCKRKIIIANRATLFKWSEWSEVKSI